MAGTVPVERVFFLAHFFVNFKNSHLGQMCGIDKLIDSYLIIIIIKIKDKREIMLMRNCLLHITTVHDFWVSRN